MLLPRFSIRLQRHTLGATLANPAKPRNNRVFRSAKIAHTGTPESLVPKEPDSLPHCPPQREKPHLKGEEQNRCRNLSEPNTKQEPRETKIKKPGIFQEKRGPGQGVSTEKPQPFESRELQTLENAGNHTIENEQTAQIADDRNHETAAERELRVVAQLRSRWEPIFSRSTPQEISVLLRAALKRARYRAYRPDLDEREHEEAEIERAWIEQEITEREGED